MKTHESFYATTCWFCGHPRTGQRAIRVAEVRYGCCQDCERAPVAASTAEDYKAAIWKARQEDLFALVEGRFAHPRYWRLAAFQDLQAQAHACGKLLLRALAPKEYADEFAAATKERIEERRRKYKRDYAAQHKEKKDG